MTETFTRLLQCLIVAGYETWEELQQDSPSQGEDREEMTADGQHGGAECRIDEQELADGQLQAATTADESGIDTHGRRRVLWPQEDLYNTVVQVPHVPHVLALKWLLGRSLKVLT